MNHANHWGRSFLAFLSQRTPSPMVKIVLKRIPESEDYLDGYNNRTIIPCIVLDLTVSDNEGLHPALQSLCHRRCRYTGS